MKPASFLFGVAKMKYSDGAGEESSDGGVPPCQELWTFSVVWSIVPVKTATPWDHIRASLVESFQEFLQGSKDIICINNGVPGSVVCVDNILAIEKR